MKRPRAKKKAMVVDVARPKGRIYTNTKKSKLDMDARCGGAAPWHSSGVFAGGT